MKIEISTNSGYQILQILVHFLVWSAESGWEFGSDKGTKKHWMTKFMEVNDKKSLMEKQWELETSLKCLKLSWKGRLSKNQAISRLEINSHPPKSILFAKREKYQPSNKTTSYLLPVQHPRVTFSCIVPDQGHCMIQAVNQCALMKCFDIQHTEGLWGFLHSLLRVGQLNQAHFHL